MVSPRPARRSSRGPQAWETWPQALRLLVTGRTWRTAFPAALVVGTLLSVVNQGGALLAGDLEPVTVARVVANYLIPFLVASWGTLSAWRVGDPAEGGSGG